MNSSIKCEEGNKRELSLGPSVSYSNALPLEPSSFLKCNSSKNVTRRHFIRNLIISLSSRSSFNSSLKVFFSTPPFFLPRKKLRFQLTNKKRRFFGAKNGFCYIFILLWKRAFWKLDIFLGTRWAFVVKYLSSYSCKIDLLDCDFQTRNLLNHPFQYRITNKTWYYWAKLTLLILRWL